ncbi:MAG: hypothetical protein ACM30I_09120 [Gemmatimonas sp.]
MPSSLRADGISAALTASPHTKHNATAHPRIAVSNLSDARGC